MLLAIRENTSVYWEGKHTQTLQGEQVFPRAHQNPIKVCYWWNYQSVVRAAKLGLPVFAIMVVIR